MKHFITGCGKDVPVSERADEGYLATEAAKNACTKEGAGLLIVQNHEQAKLMCRGCPKCGPVAPHLTVVVGADRTRTLAEPAEPAEPAPSVDGKDPRRMDGKTFDDAGGFARPTPAQAPVCPSCSSTDPASEAAGVCYDPFHGTATHTKADADQAAHHEEMEKEAMTKANAVQPGSIITPPSAPEDDKPAWMRELLQSAGAAPAPEPTPALLNMRTKTTPQATFPDPVFLAEPEPEPQPQPDEVADVTRSLDISAATQKVLDSLTPRELEVLTMRLTTPPALGALVDKIETIVDDAAAAAVEPEPVPQPSLVDSQVVNGWTPATVDGQTAAGAAFDAAMTHPAATPPILSLLSPDVNTGPSVMGSSTLRAFQLCMRAGFYRIMKGIRRRRKTERFDDRGTPKFDPLALGTLVHGVLARFYQGHENPYDFLEAVKPHYPNIVEETKRLCTYHFNAYAERDRQVLDVRFVELESRYYFKKKRVKSAKKNFSLCVSSRHDLGYRKMRPDEPRLPPGVAASGVTIMDHKTIGNMTQDAQSAYRHDPQIFTNAVTYERGNTVERDGTLGGPSAEIYGPLTHFGINLIGKAMHHDPTKHLVRLTQIIPRDLLDSYADDIQQWLYTELADRMFHPAAQDDETWPKSYLCRDPSTGRPCAYMELCERGGLKRVNPAVNYDVGEPYDIARLIRPEVAKKGRKPKAKAAADVERK